MRAWLAPGERAVAVLGVVFAAALGGPLNGAPAATLIHAFRWVVLAAAGRAGYDLPMNRPAKLTH